MPRIAALIMIAFTLTGGACPKENGLSSHDNGSAELPKARDGNIAIRQELEAARRTGTVEAYDLFIARHPNHPLAEIARSERNGLISNRSRR